MDLKGKRLLLLGGSRITNEIIRHARAMGVVTGVTDWYAYEKSPAKQLADEAYYESTADIDAMVKLIKDNHFDGVFTGFTDSVLPYYAEICGKAGLPSYGTKEQFEIFISKQKYKKLMKEFDIPVIPEYVVDPEDIENTAKDIKYPVLVKPSDGSGAKGVSICRNIEELKAAMELAGKESKAHEVLVEHYVDAPEATVFWLFVRGEYYVTLVGNRHVKYNQEGVIPLPVGYTYPASVQKVFLEQEAPKWKKLFRSLDVRDGMMFMQCKITDGIPVVYDIGFRLTGSLEYKNLKAACGYDPMDMMIRFALTGDMGEPEIEKKVDPDLGGKYSYNVSVLSSPGKIEEIQGLDDVMKIPGVIDAVVAHPAGDEITMAMKGRLAQITVRILGVADTIDDMREKMIKIKDTLHVISTEGKELALPGLVPEDFSEDILL